MEERYMRTFRVFLSSTFNAPDSDEVKKLRDEVIKLLELQGN